MLSAGRIGGFLGGAGVGPVARRRCRRRHRCQGRRLPTDRGRGRVRLRGSLVGVALSLRLKARLLRDRCH